MNAIVSMLDVQTLISLASLPFLTPWFSPPTYTIQCLAQPGRPVDSLSSLLLCKTRAIYTKPYLRKKKRNESKAKSANSNEKTGKVMNSRTHRWRFSPFLIQTMTVVCYHMRRACCDFLTQDKHQPYIDVHVHRQKNSLQIESEE